MEIKISTKLILQILHVLSWIIFIGLCIEAGSFIFSACYTHFMNHNNVDYFGLSELYRFDPGYFAVEILLITIPCILKAVMFYLIVKILHDKKLDMANPFNETLQRFTLIVSMLAVGVGIFIYRATGYTEWLAGKGITMPDVRRLHLDGPDVWLFMGVVLCVIAQIFKRGIEIQSENELTI